MDEEDTKKFNLYLNHLNKQLKQLSPAIEKLTTKSLNEQLLLLGDENAKLQLTNKFAYILSSLVFIQMKLYNVKDMNPILTELSRVKTYMERQKNITSDKLSAQKDDLKNKKMAKSHINSILGDRSPAISSQNFERKHTKFTDADSKPTKHIQKPNRITKK